MRVIVLASLAAAASLAARPAVSPPQDPAALLAEARAAMGGAALDAIDSISVSGSETQDIGGITTSRSVEINYQKPDKFVRTTRATFQDPRGLFTMTTHNGFNGPVRIHVVSAPGAPMPVVIPGPEPKTPEDRQALEERQMREQRIEFARIMIPLFAQSMDAYPVAFRSEGSAIVLTALDDTEIRLFLDPATRLPARIDWKAQPIVVFSTSRTVTTNSRGGVVSESPGSPMPSAPGPQQDVLWSMTIEDYKTDAGITWPRRFRTTIAGKRYEDVKLGKYKINQAIKPSVFEPRK